VDSFAALAAGGVAGTCTKRTSGLRRVAAGQLWLPGTSGDAAHYRRLLHIDLTFPVDPSTKFVSDPPLPVDRLRF
jgi:hypothetical protein